jgi:photosystem II stability/assembly factor-like uncharacterized protein
MNPVQALAASGMLCFAARPSGLSRSDDGGATWQDAYGSLSLKAPLPTAVVALSPQFATDQTVFAGVPGGILRSTDAGQTWAVSQLPSPPPFVTSLAVSPFYAHDGVVLAGTMEDGVYRSGDRGSHWEAWNFRLLDLNVLCLAMSSAYADDETVYAGTESGIFYSTNGGRAWRELDFSPDWAPVLSLAVSPHHAADGLLFAGTESAGLFASRDRGGTWAPCLPSGQAGEGLAPSAVNAILVGEGGLVLALLPDQLLVSGDGGQSWAGWQRDMAGAEGLTAVAAPMGLGPAAPLLVGLTDGTVRRV